jgi:hypothetical protein
VSVEELVIDIDTGKLLTAAFAVEELTLDGVRGTFDRLRVSERKPEREQTEPAREFTVQRLHFGDVALALRDHTGASMREFEVALAELDIGPVASDSVAFDLLYRSRGRGSIAGHEFSITAIEAEAGPQSTFEVHGIPLEVLAERLEKAAGVRASGSASLTVVNHYVGDLAEPRVDIQVALRLRELKLEASRDATMGTRMMLQMAERQLAKFGDEFPLAFEVSVLRSELAAARNFAESGVVERVTDAIVAALKQQLTAKDARG